VSAAPQSYEERDCYACDRGRVYVAPTLERPGGWRPCPRCNGTRRVLVFVYAKMRRSR
jgi:hypothetical protein